MAYSVYGMIGQMKNTEGLKMQKPRKHPYLCQHRWTCKDYPECPKWHQTALKVASAAVVLLVATMIGLTVWIKPKLKVCPNDWLQNKGKCYKFFRNFESWINSQKLCSVKKSHLLIIQDKSELDFIQNNIQDGIYFWIGLNIIYPPKAWTWLDGNPLNPQLFQVTGQAEENACAVITRKGVFSEKCSNPSYWICQEVIY
ncbi:killer cell lectin-like receptor subfamily F member 2 [Rhynchocyon petersi]